MIEGLKFLVFCEEAKVACPVDKYTVFEISSLIFMSLLDEKEINKLPQRKEVYKKIRDYNTLLRVGFYFSPDFTITRSI